MIEKLYFSSKHWSTTEFGVVSLIILGFLISGCASSKQQMKIEKKLFQAKDTHTMEPRILQVDGFMLLGTATRIKMGSESTEEFGKIWKDFELWHNQIRSHTTDRCYYGVSFGTEQEAIIDYVAGMAVENVQNAPEGLVLRKIPEGLFAVFSCPVQDIGQTYRYIFSEWLAISGFQLNGSAPSFEKYPAEDVVSPVLIHIPIQRTQRK